MFNVINFIILNYENVPVVDVKPEQGLQTNVFDTLNVLNAAISENVNSFVLILTDKSVRPTNSTGASKRIAELVLQAKADMQPSSRISMVQFGNVLSSPASIVPKFKRQIKQGGSITLTDTLV